MDHNISNNLINKIRRVLKRNLYKYERYLYLYDFLNTKNNPVPDFICIGAQKAGTTWLYENLKEHPQINLPQSKELHYFNHKCHEYSINWYLSHFKNKNDKVTGDITPAYSTLTDLEIKFIKKLFPKIKIIYLLRNPIDRAWSAAKMHLIELECKRKEDVSIQEYIDHFHSVHSLSRGDYINTYKRYAKYFGHENIYIGFYEQIKRNPKALLVEIFEFLDIDTDIDWSKLKIDEVIAGSRYGNVIPEKCLNELKQIYCDKIKEIEKYFGGYASEWRC